MPEAFSNIKGHHVDQFSDLTQLRAQQLTKKLEDTAIEESATGRAHYFDQVGLTEFKEDNTRFPESPHQEIEHYRRKVTPRRFHWGHNLDQFDTAQMFTSKEGKYVLAASGAYGRTFDTIHINALGGNAIAENSEGVTTTIPLPSTQKVAITVGGTSGNVNLNEEKVRDAISIITDNDVDIDDPSNRLYGCITPKALFKGLMAQDKVTSSDFNIVKPLAGGGQMTFFWMGVDWIVSSRLPAGTTTPATDRFCYVWSKSGLGRAMWSELVTKSAERADRSFIDYIYMRSFFNVTRLEEEKVVEIEIDEDVGPLVG